MTSLETRLTRAILALIRWPAVPPLVRWPDPRTVRGPVAVPRRRLGAKDKRRLGRRKKARRAR